jgi:heme/copper-type cytochrome/quinol oxidase subunit 4
MICLLVALREALSLDRQLSRKILLLGCVTFSVAHLIFLLVYFLFIDKKSHSVFLVLAFAGLAITFFIFTDIVSLFREVFFNRFTIVDGEFLGDNRSSLFFNALNYIDYNVFFFGLDNYCILRHSQCNISVYEPYGDNPLSLLVHYGLTLSWAYYALLLYLIYRSFRGNFMSFGVFFLLLLKPYLYSFGFTIMLVLYAHVLINQSNLFPEIRSKSSKLKQQA